MRSALPHPAVLSRLYLGAVLPCLSELCAHDPLTRQMLGRAHASIVLRILGGPGTKLHLSPGKIECEVDGSYSGTIVLLFLSESHLNAFFAGRKWAVPLPIWGGWRVGILARFSRIAQRLEAVLDAHASVLEDPAGRHLYTRLSLMTAGLGLGPLAQGDEVARLVLRTLPFGLACFTILGEQDATVWFDYNAQRCRCGWGEPPHRPEVCIAFDGMETAYDAMRDRIDAVAAVGTGKIQVDGLVPLADGLNFIMQRLRTYLQP